MKLITSFDDALHYVNHLGFAGNGTIQCQQDNLCHACDLLLSASGQSSWHKIQPFMVRHKRFGNRGPDVPWLSRFLVIRNGSKKVLSMKWQQHTDYMPIAHCGGYGSMCGTATDPWHTCPQCQCDNG